MDSNPHNLAWSIAERLILLRVWKDSAEVDRYLQDLLVAFTKAAVKKAQQSTDEKSKGPPAGRSEAR